jgi:site-specific DNA-methyltransferase (adenine-specific)
VGGKDAPTIWIEDKMKNQVICGDCKEVLRRFPPNTFDTVITDPPYGLGFMGKEWDNLIEPTRDSAGGFLRNNKSGSNPYAAARCRLGADTNQMQQWHYEWAKICLRVAKPGAMMLVFGGTRTFHRLACAIEDAGWQIRDCMMWLYGSGFPKSLDISKAIDKAAGAERKIIAANKHANQYPNGPGGVGFHGGPGEYSQISRPPEPLTIPATPLACQWDGWGTALKPAWEPIIVAMKSLDGTFAHNAETHGVAGLNVDEGRIEGKQQGRWPANLLLDEESAELLGQPARFFYCAKAGKKERNIGLDGEGQIVDDGRQKKIDNPYLRGETLRQNIHPTVKPLALMEYLCKLTKTPTGGLVLDPFGGSGTTALACIKTGRDYVLIEKEPEYCEIANKRIGGLKEQLSAMA